LASYVALAIGTSAPSLLLRSPTFLLAKGTAVGGEGGGKVHEWSYLDMDELAIGG